MSVKVVFNQDIRRVKVDFNGPNPFRQLTQALCEAFNLADNTKFVLKYQDDEDEMITISSSTELVEAERIASQEARKNLKVFVFVDGAAPPAHVGDDISIASDESFVVTASTPVSRQASKTASVDVPRAAPAPEAAEEEVKIPEPAEPTPTPTPVADAAPATETKTESPVEPELPCWRELLPEFRDFIRDPKIHEALRPLLPAIFDSVTSGQATPSSFADLLLQAPAIKNHPLVQKILPFLPRALECLNNLKQHVGAWMQQVASLIESMCVGVQSDQEFRFDIPMWLPQHFQHMFAPQASRGPSAFSSSSSGPKPVHRSVQCDGCRMYPVVGARFKCTVCDDFDLCENCETRAVHPPDHPLLKIYRPAIETDEQGRFIHRGYRCDGCDVAPIVGNRYNCTVCRNFDLCDECEAKSQHPVDHPLLKIKEPKAPQEMCGRRSGLGRMLRAMRALAVATPSENAPAAAAPKEAKVKRARRCVRRREARAEPHVTFEASVQPQVSTTAADAAFVKDHSIPDKSFCLPSVTLRKVWIMRNSGAAQWPQGTSLAYLSGSVLPVEGALFLAPVDLAQPGEEVAVTVDVITPAKPGHHFGYFTLQTADGVRFGHRVWVEVNVTASGKTSTGQDVATPAATPVPVPVAVAVEVAEEVKVEDVKVEEPAAPAPSTPEAAAEVKAEEPKVEAAPAPAPVAVAAPEVKAEEPVVAAPAPAPSAPVLEVPVVRPVSPVDDFVHVPRVQFSLPPNFDHGAQLQYLLGMGFTDRQRLINLLNAHGGNLEVVINRLL